MKTLAKNMFRIKTNLYIVVKHKSAKQTNKNKNRNKTKQMLLIYEHGWMDGSAIIVSLEMF